MIDIEQLEKEITAFHENVVASSELLATLRSIVDALKENTNTTSSRGKELLDEYQKQINENAKQSQWIAESTNELKSTAEKQHAMLTDSVAKAVSNIKKMTEESTESLCSSAQKTAEMLEKSLDDSNRQLHESQKAALEEAAKLIQDTQSQLQAQTEKIHSDAYAILQAGEKQTKDLSETFQGVTEGLVKANAISVEEAAKKFARSQETYLTELDNINHSFEEQTEKIGKQHQLLVRKMEDAQIDQLFDEVSGMKKMLSQKLAILLCGIGVAVVLGIVNLFI